jgi:hypothetical protein
MTQMTPMKDDAASGAAWVLRLHFSSASSASSL